MFSLIVTIVSIVLVALLTLATLYFGGSSLTKGEEESRAVTVLTQGQQVLSAADLFRAEIGRWPNSMDELLTKGYLKQIPSVRKAATATVGALDVTGLAFAQQGSTLVQWTQPKAGEPTFLLPSSVSVKECQLINKKSRGDNGILKQAHTTLASQCFGQDDANLSVVVSKTPATLASALDAALVKDGAIPTDSGAADWLVAPGADASQVVAPKGPSGLIVTLDVPPGYTSVPSAGTQVLQYDDVIHVISGSSSGEYMAPIKVHNPTDAAIAVDFKRFEGQGNVWVLDEILYYEGGTVEQARELAQSYFGVNLCEANSQLEPGQSCYLLAEVPGVNACRVMRYNPSPLKFEIGPRDCLETVSSSITQYVFGTGDIVGDIIVKNLPASGDYGLFGSAQFPDDSQANYGPLVVPQITAVESLGDGLSKISFRIPAMEQPFDVDIQVQHYSRYGGSWLPQPIEARCPTGYDEPAYNPFSAKVECVPSFLVFDDNTSTFEYSYWSEAPVEGEPVQLPEDDVPDTQYSVFSGSLNPANGSASFKGYIRGEGSKVFSQKMLQAFKSGTIRLKADGVTGSTISCRPAQYNWSAEICTVEGSRALNGGQHRYALSFFFTDDGSGTKLQELRVRVDDYADLDTDPTRLNHLNVPQFIEISAEGSKTDLAFGIRSDGVLLKPSRDGYYIKKELRFVEGMVPDNSWYPYSSPLF